jgi:transposase-like protein
VGCSRAAGCSFVDERLNKRLHKLVAQIGSAMGQSIPLVCQDWANTKAAYRFLSNDEQRPLSAPSCRCARHARHAGSCP